ncbi:hypothetical protein FOMPIDRAFT_1055731 [Fomitopsis schrenkii]|uniref:Uncharacterized protein n=1 Tax=Fomitopsis schrenkii TaxID=2126942 RepID=S8EVR9_FOMSC|nr:hypothetical protein FOMPIDRAFT_1055731 [Fomitopsis schrenkii]
MREFTGRTLQTNASYGVELGECVRGMEAEVPNNAVEEEREEEEREEEEREEEEREEEEREEEEREEADRSIDISTFC